MNKNSSISKRTVFVRVAAVLTAAVMLLSAAACGEDTNEVSSENTMTELKVEELDTELQNFLIRFTDWYESDEEQKVYDCQQADSSNILRSILGNAGCVEWDKYPVGERKEVYDSKKLDPKKWAKQSGGSYIVFNSKDADWIALNIFNVTEKDIEAMREQGEKNQWFYLDGDKYYTVIYGVGDPLTEYTFESAKTDGTVYYVNYSSSFNNGEEIIPNGTFSAEVQKKTIDGKDYWTLNKFEQTSGGE